MSAFRTAGSPALLTRLRVWVGYQPEQGFRTALTYFLMTAVALSTVGPFIIMLSVSLTKDIRFLLFPIDLIPQPATLENFQLLFARTMALRWLYNSFYVALISTLGGVFTSTLAGYAFARGDFIGRNLLFYVFVGILIMPDTALIIPQYILLADLKLVNTYTALIGPWFASIFGTFLMRQQFLSIPRDYDDAAKIDGANIFQTFWRVLMPQLVPAMVTLAILRFMGNWNSFLYPLIVTTKAEMRTLPVGLGTVARSGGDAGLDMAGAVLGFLPTFLVFLLGQRYIIQGVSLSGLKG